MLKPKILILGLAMALSVNLAGCAGTSSPEQQTKQSSPGVTEDQQQSTDPKTATPSEPQTPTNTPPAETGVKETEEPNASGAAALDAPLPPSNKAPAAVEPKIPAKPALPQGTVSLKVGATLPEFVLTDLKGNTTSASAVITGHQLTFINFWTTT
ncbi:hypothetical protein [Desulforamulus aeronauticus]|uniref:AhpC/TSA family protein n=1 Tax=Desulforamulus aeronauticus DSM 10349 TaxID=1121421 RepID=A0A1M6VV78_9FIRM|nr:hypothetical protein [Desulforamulus aeronauticus]SHK85360.1 hypothetical protein SAMN02745123_03372 [Desulforamulus aeronauticus DSM 10349]